MTAIHLQPCHEQPAMLPRRAAGLWALNDATGWIFATIGQWRRRARARAELAALDERSLNDIGLTRSDAEYLINKPFWRE